MSVELFISRTWRYASMLAFALILLFTYRGLPDYTAVHFGPNGRGDGFLPKDEIFYLFLAISLVVNILPITLAKMILKLPDTSFSWIPNKKWLANRKDLNAAIGNWLNFLPAFINTFLILVLRAILTLNDDRSFNTSYTYLLVVGVALTLAWLFYLPVKLLYTNPSVIEED
ncbi:hypothetical protein [Flectobacillus roseus]|uniref:hypothetical protein n=1 Tax=Flectobacillus roseus TaxID=502259 RepID=UPI0024B7D23C|nr:hypothetical protein [Flectobacillus roseus]MDI9872424.1 hypothetical protein [Flectobacillus roseus]